MKIENIKVCAFDAYGTCFDVNSAAKFLEKKIGSNWLNFSNTWRTVQLEYTWLRSLMKKHADFWKITEDSLDYAMNVYGIDKVLREELLNLYKNLDPYPELSKCLKDLKKKKIKTCILSNGTPSLLENLLNTSGTKKFFDKILSVEAVKIYKPDPKVYQLVTSEFNCKPNNVCFLSSNTWDVIGGGVFGYQSVWVNRTNKIFDKLDYQPKFIVKNLGELINFL